MKPYLKALYAGVVATLAFLTPALADSKLDAVETVGLVSAFVLAAGGVYFVPYESTKPSTENAEYDRY